MNINPEFNESERPNAEDVMSEAMDFLWKKFILPKAKQSSEDDLDTLALIGIAMKDIAEKAEAYYQMHENKENDFYRN